MNTPKKFPTLKQKIELKKALEEKLVKVEDEIDEITGEKKVKITKINK